MQQATKEDVLKVMDSMDALLAVDKDDPVMLIAALRRVTVNSSIVGGLTGSSHLKTWIINAVDICTAYVQKRITQGREDPYREVVEEYRQKIGELGLTETP